MQDEVHDMIVSVLWKLNKKEWEEWYSEFKVGHGEYKKDTALSISKIVPCQGGSYPASPSSPYKPDAWGKRKDDNKIDVYEVWNTESETEAIEDIVLTSLVENISTLTVFCTGRGISKDKADQLCDLILYHTRTREDSKPLVDDWKVIEIPEEKLQDRKKLFNTLKKNKWLEE